ncbi:hypothetical protein [Paenibacillus polysaccharolyticus]
MECQLGDLLEHIADQ